MKLLATLDGTEFHLPVLLALHTGVGASEILRSAAQADHIAGHDDYHTTALSSAGRMGAHGIPAPSRLRGLVTAMLPASRCASMIYATSHASLLLSAGAYPKALQERLGHSSAAFTMNVYAHLLPGVQGEAMASLEALLEQAESKPESSDD